MKKDEDAMKWEVLGTEYLFRRPWLTARRDHVRLPSGVEIPEYYVLEYPDWVNMIVITEEGDFVFVRQYRHGAGETRFELVAGVVDPEDASPMEAAKRELYEETGFGGGEWREFCTLCPNSGAMTNTSHTFLATGVRRLSTQHLEATEDITVHLFSREEVLEMLKQGEIRQALMAAPLWRYFAEEAGV